MSKTEIDSPFFVMAKSQTKGKGQRGHQWKSLRGGLYLSLYLDVEVAIENLHHLTLMTVTGIVQQLQNHHIPVQIKWLNDLILVNKKLGGILCESKLSNKRIKQFVIGVGVNYQNATPTEGINLQEYSRNSNITFIESIDKLAQLVVQGILGGYYQYRVSGINQIVNLYNNFLHNINQSVLIAENKGIILGINHQGKLQVKIASSTASSRIFLAPENYSLSYHPNADNYYLLTSKQ